MVSPCDQCHGVGAECRALSLFSTCGWCTVKGVQCLHNASRGRGSDVVSVRLVIENVQADGQGRQEVGRFRHLSQARGEWCSGLFARHGDSCANV